MDFKMHASKLHMRETSNTVRNGIHVQVVKKHGCLEQPLEQLNKITDPSCVSDGIVVFRINGENLFPKQSEKSSSGTKLVKKGTDKII